MKKLPFLSLFALSSAAIAQPNVVFLLMDDLGYGDVEFMGQEKIETPNIDALAESGMTFTQHYTGAPVSAPARCSLLTGLHTGHAQIRGNDEDASRGNVQSHRAMFENMDLEGQKPMAANTKTLAHYFKNAGYTTGCFGKWGLGAPNSVSTPNKMGFDQFYGYNCQRQAHTYFPPHLYQNEQRTLLPNKVLEPHFEKLDSGANCYDKNSYAKFTQKAYAPDSIFAKTVDFIEQNADKAFFLFWTTPLPHVSLQAPDSLVEYYRQKFGDEEPYLGNQGYFPCRYPKATYAAMVTYIDQQVGEIVKLLKAKGIYENTLIVFTSDNGPTFNGGTNSPWFDSAQPFKSEYGWGKCFLHEGGIRVPTIVSWSGKVAARTKSDLLCGFQDWLPTFSSIIGEKCDNTDGISLLPTFTNKGRQKKHKQLYWEFPEMNGSFAVRQGDWKLIVENADKNPKYSLFNLKNDAREQKNLYQTKNKTAKRLIKVAQKEHIQSSNPKFRINFFDKK